MKYNKLYIAGFFLAALALGSCKDDFLDKKPLNQISETAVWSDYNLSRTYVNNLYLGLPNGFDRGFMMLSSATDESENTYQWTDAEMFNRGDYNASNFPKFGTQWDATWALGPWRVNYDYIRRCNLLLEKASQIPGTEAQRNELIGEAKFLRAIYYEELVKLYGGIPIVTEAHGIDNLEALLVPRSSYEETINFIVKELDEAAALLPQTRYRGRAVRGSAMALKGRVLLFAGSPKNNNGSYNTNRMAASAAASKAVMDAGIYSLFPQYGPLFLEANNTNIEVIFDNQHLRGIRGQPVDMFNNPAGMAGGGWGGTSPTQDLVDDYEMMDGKRYDESPLYSPTAPYQNRDPRFSASIFYEGASWGADVVETRIRGLSGIDGGPNGNNADATRTGYYMRKFLDVNNRPRLYEFGSRASFNNWIILRLAEVLLNYAEAQNEAVGPDASVYEAVNRVRKRVNMPDLPAGLSKDQMRAKIRQERRIELAFEEHRFYDVRRWGLGEQIFNRPIHGMRIGPNGEFTGTFGGRPLGRIQVEDRVFQSQHYLMPIPQSELDRNPQLQQNPGW